MPREFSVYEAKKRLSEILRGVRERGERYVVTYHGEPIAEIGPIGTAEHDGAVPARWRELEARGVILPAKQPGPLSVKPVAHVPGGLRRFLDERD